MERAKQGARSGTVSVYGGGSAAASVVTANTTAATASTATCAVMQTAQYTGAVPDSLLPASSSALQWCSTWMPTATRTRATHTAAIAARCRPGRANVKGDPTLSILDAAELPDVLTFAGRAL